jgi:NADPH:quinone reductase-like Zn-dependent oxidoreductase
METPTLKERRVPDSETVLVTGATRNTGSPLLPMLEARGVSVRAMIRSAGDESRVTQHSARRAHGYSRAWTIGQRRERGPDGC